MARTDQLSELDFYSASSLKQQSTGRYVSPVRHNILIQSQSVFALTLQWCVLSGEATNTNFIVFGLTRPGLEPMIYRTQGKSLHHRYMKYNNDFYTSNSFLNIIWSCELIYIYGGGGGVYPFSCISWQYHIVISR
jgi:hypothetical protein